MCACAGYANECGEAFRPLVPVEIVYFTYFLAISYVLADTVDKGKKGAAAPGDDSTLRATFGAVDTFMWQAGTSLRPPPLLTPHASRLTPHASRLAPRASRLAPHASRLPPRCSLCPVRLRVADARVSSLPLVHHQPAGDAALLITGGRRHP